MAKEKVELAALGTKPGAQTAQVKGVGEEAAKHLEDAKETAASLGKPGDSADIEE
jgi:hypothetical protein